MGPDHDWLFRDLTQGPSSLVKGNPSASVRHHKLAEIGQLVARSGIRPHPCCDWGGNVTESIFIQLLGLGCGFPPDTCLYLGGTDNFIHF